MKKRKFKGYSRSSEPKKTKYSKIIISVRDLIKSGVIKAGTDVLKIDYSGRLFIASLTEEGIVKFKNPRDHRIHSFESLSSWSIFCKRLINPSRRGN